MSEPQSLLVESVSTTNETYFILVYITILIYCCFGLAVVCDVYFVPALQKISKKYNLPPDIAGSTLMALGASVPELFASLIGVFVTEDDIGTGSIIGSSCFNLIAVPAVIAIVAAASFDYKLTVSPMPVLRNSSFYAITILVLLLIIKDNKVDILEATILLLFFVMYMALMLFSCNRRDNNNSGSGSGSHGYINFTQSHHNNARDSNQQQQQLQQQLQQKQHQQQLASEHLPLLRPALAPKSAGGTQLSLTTASLLHWQPNNVLVDVEGALMAEADDDEDGGKPHTESWLHSKWILLPMLPLTLSMTILTPCKFKSTFATIWTFIVSIGLIGALTYVSVWMVHSFGKTLGIPETIAGMTILSWGTGIPELIASIVLIRKTGQADMAICNTIGSNVIDVSFCLSLPWIVKCFMNKASHMKPIVEIQSEALPWTSSTLLVCVILLVVTLKLHNWKLSYSVGVWLLAIYALFVVVATYLEYKFAEGGFDLLAAG